MKIRVKENFSNMQKGRPYKIEVDPVLGIALEEDDEAKEKTKEVFDPYVRGKAKPFLGAEKQPVPKDPVEPKLTLKENYRSYADRLQDMIEDSLVETLDVVSALVKRVPQRKLKEFLEVRNLKEDFDPDPRHYSNQVIDMIESGMLDAEDVAISLIKWMPDSEIEKFMLEYGLDDNLEESLLTERNWKTQLESGKQLRDAINREDYEGVIEGIRACYKEMMDKGVIDEDDFYDWTEQLDWLDLDDEDAEEAIDYELDNLYDACDNLDCWVAM